MNRASYDDAAAVALLERAISYTRGRLVTVREEHLDRATPCHGWRLRDLMAHMEDALDAFTEGADGAIGRGSTTPAPLAVQLTSLQTKACALLGGWTRRLEEQTGRSDADQVLIAGHALPLALLANLAAVEIAVHGWDVGRTTGEDRPLPEGLATALLPWAHWLGDAVDEFGPRVIVEADAGVGPMLLGLLGRVA